MVVVARMGPVRSGSARIRSPSRRATAGFSKSIRLLIGAQITLRDQQKSPTAQRYCVKARGEKEGKVGNRRGTHDGRQ